ncbi:MAG: efflux RND transporter periplasmic adaptor subunit [Verrucomicrobiae bacterium]|nr:efflux RND transporter periplasmic adaptor subunit [Verrucomicrobiae bacterium]
MKRFVKFLLGLALLGAGVGISALLYITRPVAEKKPATTSATVVQVMKVGIAPEQIVLPSQGVVEPRQQTRLSAEVSGRVIRVAEGFDAGTDFAEGETLVWIDPSDYEAALFQAEAALKDAELALANELAKADQAKKDWDALNMKGEASDLTLRLPQLASARAAKTAAEGAVAKAKRDLERTQIKAPFAGRIASISAELGAFLTPGAPVADFYSGAPFEIRLPLSLDDWALADRTPGQEISGKVMLSAEVGGERVSWEGTLVRTEGEIDRASRSVHVVAVIESEKRDPLLQPGLFLQAKIAGKRFEKLARVPMRAFVDLDRVAVVDGDDMVGIRGVKVLRRFGNWALVSDGIRDGDRVCLTQLSASLSDLEEGMKIKPQEVTPAEVVGEELEWTVTKP